MRIDKARFRRKCHFSAVFLLFCGLMVGLYEFVFDIDMQRCEMTYMFEFPGYQRYHMPEIGANASLRSYGLYRYSEGGRQGDGPLRGVPVLFIPGNSGSYKQVRSLASVSRQISLRRHRQQMFDYFSVDLNSEWSGASATIVERQIAFVVAALQHIGRLYKSDKVSVILVGHSMGGFVGRAAIAAMSSDDRLRVRLLIALAAPLEMPVASLDGALWRLYGDVNDWWRRNDAPAVVSLTGGNRDLLVHDRLGRPLSSRAALWLPTTAVKAVWASTDHLCIVWCRQLVVAINNALYRLLEGHSDGASISSNSSAIIALIQDQLRDDNAVCVTSNGGDVQAVDSLWQLLWRRPRLTLLSADTANQSVGTDRRICVPLRAASFATRPLRIQITASSARHCPQHSVQVSLIVPHHDHSYRQHIRINGPSVLIALADNAPHDMPPVLQLRLSGECRDIDVHLLVWASPIDWVAQFMRVHAWRLMVSVSAGLVLRLFGWHSALLLLVTGAIGWLSLHVSAMGLSTLSQIGAIDMWDVALLLAFGVPITECVSLLARIALRIVAIVSRMLLPVQWQPSIIALFLPPIIAMVITPDAPIVAQSLLTLSYLVAVQVVPRTSASATSRFNSRSINVTSVLLMLALLQAAPSISLWHASLQHQSVREVLLHWLRGLTQASNYNISLSFLLVSAVSIVSATRSGWATQPELPRSEIGGKIHATSAVALASGCLIQGSLDISQCSTYLVAALLFSEMADFVTAF